MRLAIRGSQGLHMVKGPPDYAEEQSFPSDKSSKCKVRLQLSCDFESSPRHLNARIIY